MAQERDWGLHEPGQEGHLALEQTQFREQTVDTGESAGSPCTESDHQYGGGGGGRGKVVEEVVEEVGAEVAAL